MPPSAPINLFYSYCHKDEALRKKLEASLSLLRRQDVIREWHDRRIEPGTEWSGQIDHYLDAADVILLLVSTDFLASDFCYGVEMKQALERHDAGTVRVIPVILRPCDWRSAPFGKLQSLPKDGKPVTAWKSRDEAFTDVAHGIRRVVQGLTSRPPNPSTAVQHTPVGTPPHGEWPPALMDRYSLVNTLEQLTPADFQALVTRISGAASQVSRHGTIAEHTAELVRWAESPRGCGLAAVAEALAGF
jgi:hypothetical protein